MIRRLSKLVIIVFAAVGAACGGAQDPRPNVILVSIDTLRADHVGCYGAEGVSTPTMDRLAGEGLRFERCFAPVPITLPSHCSMFTGMVPPRHSVRDNGTFTLPEDVPTLATVLEAEGYATLGVIGAYPLISRFGLARGFDVWDEELGQRYQGVLPLFFEERKADLVSQRAIEVVDAHGDEPVLLFVHYFDPHHPWDPPEPFNLRYLNLPYDGEIAFVDRWLGRLVEHLESRGLLDRSILVVTADHGEGLMEHGEMSHSLLLYNGTQHVPLIIRAPGLEPGVVARPVSLVDVAPTILDLLGLGLPGPVDGRSLVAGGLDERPIYLESLTGRLTHGWNDMRAVVEGRWKYHMGVEPELYDLEEDFRETTNLAGSHPDRVSGMDALLRSMIASSVGPHRLSDRYRTPDDDVKAKLQALGYLASSDVSDDLEELGPMTPEGDPRRHTTLVAIVSAARERIGRGDFLGAMAILEDALTDAPDDGELLRQMANASLFAQDYTRALAASRRLLEVSNRDAAAIFLAALAHQGVGDVDAALDLVERGLELTPGDERMLLVKSRLQVDRGDPSAATSTLEGALAERPCSRDLLVELARLLRTAGDRDAAEAAYERMVECDPGDAAALYNLGNLAMDRGNLEVARLRYEEAAGADPRYPAAHYGLALVHRANGHLEAARDEARRAMDLAGVHSPFGRRAAELLEAVEHELAR